MVYFTQSEYFFTVWNLKMLCFSALGTTQKWRRTHVPTIFQELFLSSYIKLRWKMMKPNIKVERISVLLAETHCKMENYFCISAESWLLPDDLQQLSINSPNHHTQAWNSINFVFLTSCSMLMIRGLLCYLTLLKGWVFPVVSQSTHGLISKT